ncbi:MAG: sigma-70 family RNA polymerase sigma factor [Bacillota bacterium]
MSQQKDLVLLEKIRACNDPAAKEDLVRKYLPMIHHIVKGQISQTIDYEDYIQEGSIGLLKAIEEYDPEHYAIKFSTFAYICILRRIYNMNKQLLTKKALFTSKAISLHATFGEDDSRTVLDSIADNTGEPFAQVEKDWIREEIDRILQAYLSPVEYRVVKMVLQDYNLGDIQKKLELSMKVIDNARTRARLKLKKVLFRYGSFLNPEIPMKARKRKDLAMRLEVG